MLEKEIEEKLIKAVKAAGGICLKYAASGTAGMPDRLVFLPGGRMGFVEVKAPGKRPRQLQLVRHRKLKGLGYRVFVLDDPEKIGEVLDAIRAV